MNATPRTSTRWFIAPIALLMAACGSLGASERFEPHPRPIVLPTGEGDYVLFNEGNIRRTGVAEASWTEPSSSGAAQPSAAGYDLDAGWACVGYSDQLAFVPLGGRNIRWVDAPAAGLHRSIAVRGELAAVNSGDRVRILEVPSGLEVESIAGGALLRAVDQDEFDYAEPLSDSELLLIASRDVDAFTDGRVVAMRIARGANAWEMQSHNELLGLTWADQCASKGDQVYVAGIWEETRLRSGDMPELFQSLVILRVDAETLQAKELVRDDHEPPTTVLDVAIGMDELAVLLGTGEVRVYSLQDGRSLRRQRFGRAESIAWIGPGRWVVHTEGGSKILSH